MLYFKAKHLPFFWHSSKFISILISNFLKNVVVVFVKCKQKQRLQVISHDK